MFLSAVGYQGEDLPQEDGLPRIPAEWLEACEGTQVLRLSYASGHRKNGKINYSDWNKFGSLLEVNQDDDVELQGAINKLLNEFVKDNANGYVWKYTPEVAEDNNTSDDDGAPVSSTPPGEKPPF
jgi:hypothetical protein